MTSAASSGYLWRIRLQNAKRQFIDTKDTGKRCQDVDREGFMGAIKRWCALLATSTVVTAAGAQAFPAGPITLVNPYAAGGPAYLLARTIAHASGRSAGIHGLLRC